MVGKNKLPESVVIGFVALGFWKKKLIFSFNKSKEAPWINHSYTVELFRGGYIPLINISLVYLLTNADVFAVEWKHSNKYINKAKIEIELIFKSL